MFRIYSKNNVSLLRDGIVGVYYCGYINQNQTLQPVYVGKSSSEQGVKGRLLDHLNSAYWPEATHFYVKDCKNDTEAVYLEALEIKRCQPKYNNVGK